MAEAILSNFQAEKMGEKMAKNKNIYFQQRVLSNGNKLFNCKYSNLGVL
jgi:hypothetical protein